MKKLLVALLAVTLMASPAFAAKGGGKNKARKKANVENKKDNSRDVKKCDPKDCDPRDCDPENCDPKNCDSGNCPFPTCAKEKKSSTATACSKNK